MWTLWIFNEANWLCVWLALPTGIKRHSVDAPLRGKHSCTAFETFSCLMFQQYYNSLNSVVFFVPSVCFLYAGNLQILQSHKECRKMIINQESEKIRKEVCVTYFNVHIEINI
jgi:hypothetical protein